MRHREYTIKVYRNLFTYSPDHEWVAIDDNTYDGQETDPVGYGKTAREAVINLLDALEIE